MHSDADDIELSIIAPAHNEQDNVAGLVADVETAMSPRNGAAGAGIPFEFIVIDDGSTDATRQRLMEHAATRPWMRVFAMQRTPAGRGNGQSAAFHAGIRQARGRLIALIDADRQNDPCDLPAMVQRLRDTGADMVQGDRSANRRDNAWRQFSSWVGRTFRRRFLGDPIRDTGCSLRVFKRELGLLLPLQYRGMHRFIPVYSRTLGYNVVEMPVSHRPRTAGKAKYGAWNRALPGLRDLFAVRWMRHRLRCVDCEPVGKNEAQRPQSAQRETR